MTLLITAWIGSVPLMAGADASAETSAPTVVVAEGERFAPAGRDGWAVTHQDRSYASQAFGGMWVTHGGLIGAPASCTGAVATQIVSIPCAAEYRVWSKYQSPPYFNYAHRVEIRQDGRLVFAHDYGKLAAERMYSFFGKTVYGLPPKRQVWFPWGVDHDAAEAPRRPVRLEPGPAEIRLVAVGNPTPAGDRFVDFVVLTTSLKDTCIGWESRGQAKSPFIYEALRATPIYLRFRNTIGTPARARLFTHFGHFTWSCAAKRAVVPDRPVADGRWSPWVNVNQIVELVTDEGLQVTVAEAGSLDPTGRKPPPDPLVAKDIPVQIALDAKGRQLLGALNVPNGETIHFPVDIVWNRRKRLRLSRDIASELIQRSRSGWRKACDHKPRSIAFYGAFGRAAPPWATALKDALGYNTLLPEPYEHLAVDGYYQHLRSAERIRKYAESLGAHRRNFRVCSFGDEIHLGQIDFGDPQYERPFRDWLARRGLTKNDLLAEPSKAVLNGNNRLAWYSRLFGAEQRFAHYRSLTAAAREAFGPQVLTGANYSPHHGVLYYGDSLQWIDAFKHEALSMFWTEDYIMFAPELPQVISFLFARMHCAVKYHHQPIHMYVMPHAPGQPAGYFRRNVLLSVGAGARHVDHFWVAPQERYSENYVSWEYPETFQAIFESIHDTAAVEPLLDGSHRRPARVAVITGKATALNEDQAPVDVQADPFLRMCHLAGKPVQNICRKDQQALYLALRHAQYRVDLITEDDMVEDDALRHYDVVYFAGEWIDRRAVIELDDWVRSGGILYASTGLGIRNEFNEPDDGLLRLLGLKAAPLAKGLYHYRPLLELPLAEPIDTIRLDGAELGAVAFKQALVPASDETQVLGRWSDGRAAITVRRYGHGKAIAVGTAAGATYLRTALRPVPWARGGSVNLYNPTDFAPAAERLVWLAVDAAAIERQVQCSDRHVEAFVRDNRAGTLITLVNWTNQPVVRDLNVSVKMDAAPQAVESIVDRKAVPFRYERGRVRFTIDLADADFVTLRRR